MILKEGSLKIKARLEQSWPEPQRHWLLEAQNKSHWCAWICTFICATTIMGLSFNRHAKYHDMAVLKVFLPQSKWRSNENVGESSLILSGFKVAEKYLITLGGFPFWGWAKCRSTFKSRCCYINSIVRVSTWENCKTCRTNRSICCHTLVF